MPRYSCAVEALSDNRESHCVRAQILQSVDASGPSEGRLSLSLSLSLLDPMGLSPLFFLPLEGSIDFQSGTPCVSPLLVPNRNKRMFAHFVP